MSTRQVTMAAVLAVGGLLGWLAASARAADITPAQARAIAKDAYIYGFPMVDNMRVQYSYFSDKKDPDYKALYSLVDDQ